MVYITEEGTVAQTTPWSIKKVFRFFTGIVYMIMMFFQTLINPGMNARESGYSRGYRSGSGPPARPTRRFGRPNTGDTVNIPYAGCSSCGG